ncbi:DUF3800 domain-containing protein [Nitrosopumilus sp.]|uniref:DUF3800 domain-containing protein n=1 Tax=Nitrosopumilus sp. TaxID=2024843 RepID=UPI003B59EE8B
MPHISVYVDESGDLGFSEKSSRFFTIGYAFTKDRYPLAENEIIKHALKKLNKKTKNKKNKIEEFKFSNNTIKTKCKFLQVIRDLDVAIGVICISKDSVKESLKQDLGRLYRYSIGNTIITNLVKDYFFRQDPYNSIRFVIDRSLSPKARTLFNNYCEEKASFRSRQKDTEIDHRITIKHEDSKSVPMLQVADYIAGSVQKKVERGNDIFYNVIKEKINYHEKWDYNEKIQW